MKENYKILENFPDVLRPVDLVKILNIGKNTAYKLLKSNTIHSIKIGNQYKIPKVFLLEYLLNA